MSAVQNITQKSEFDSLLSTHPYVVIQATASWCGPCKAITPIYNKQADSLAVPDRYAFARFDTDDVPDLAVELGIRTIPAFYLFKDGDKVESTAGANPPALIKLVNTYAEEAKAGGAEKPAEPAAAAPAAEETNTLKTDENF